MKTQPLVSGINFSVQLKDLSLRYHQHTLFKDLNLELPQGKCVALLGASGIGKTSLLHRIAGIKLDPGCYCSGEVQASDCLPLDGRLMLMTQQDALLPWLNVVENALLGFRLRAALNQDVKDKARQMLLAAGLSEQDCYKKPGQLSGGMRQRVALVRTLMEDKPLLLLDEPFSALDAITRYSLHETAAHLWRNKTVFLITHDPAEAWRLADYVYVMKGKPAALEKIELPASKPLRPINPELALFQAKILEQLAI